MMGYAHFDHAGWAQYNIRASKRMAEGKKKKRSDNTKGFAAAPDELSPFQRTVMNIVGIAGGGIYNAPIAWDAIQWKGWWRGIAIPWRGDLSTFDGQDLTLFVLLCHEARIRFEVRPHGFGYLLLTFFPRSDEGSVGSRHPNIDEAVESFRKYIGEDHPIAFRRPSDGSAS